MTAQMLIAIHEVRNDNRLSFVERSGHIVKRYWKQHSDAERALPIEAENRAASVAEFSI